MKREPVETMSRMELMQELTEWRRIGPLLKAVASEAQKMARLTVVTHENDGQTCSAEWRLVRAVARLSRSSTAAPKRKP